MGQHNKQIGFVGISDLVSDIKEDTVSEHKNSLDSLTLSKVTPKRQNGSENQSAVFSETTNSSEATDDKENYLPPNKKFSRIMEFFLGEAF